MCSILFSQDYNVSQLCVLETTNKTHSTTERAVYKMFVQSPLFTFRRVAAPVEQLAPNLNSHCSSQGKSLNTIVPIILLRPAAAEAYQTRPSVEYRMRRSRTFVYHPFANSLALQVSD